MDKVSIIIPIYNVEKYLIQCIESVVQQTYKNLEIILIDDGSTDMCGEICDNYAKIDQRIIAIHQNNVGAANAKNRGLEISTGEYITFLDSDDFVDLNWIETMLFYLKREKADVVECNYCNEYSGKSIINFRNCYGNFTSEEYMSHYLSDWTSSIFWTKLFKRELTDNIRFRRERRCIDDEFYTYKVLLKAKKIVRITDVLYHYRQRKSSAVGNKKNQIQITKDAIDVLQERYLCVTKQYPSMQNIFLEHDIQFLCYVAKNNVFNSDAIIKMHNTSFFYLKESLKVNCINLNFLILIKVWILSSTSYYLKNDLNEIKYGNNYFD